MENQLNITDFENFESFKVKENEDAAKDGYCAYIGRKCTQKWLHIAAKTINDDGCPEKCCIMCDKITCTVRCKGAGKRKHIIPQEYLDDGWNELKVGDNPYPKPSPNYYELQVLYKYVNRFGQDLYTPLIAAYKNREFVVLNKSNNFPKGEIVGWKYIEEPTDD